jgi:hypothetical protein
MRNALVVQGMDSTLEEWIMIHTKAPCVNYFCVMYYLSSLSRTLSNEENE